jgi:hypothetical protein
MRLFMKTRRWVFAALLAAAAWEAAACELRFKLVDASGASRRVLPGATVQLKAGASYSLHIEFDEDHRNCAVPPQETVFLIDGARWNSAKPGQGLALAGPVAWIEDGRTTNHADIPFVAAAGGIHTLSIIRDCPKGGYDETIAFSVK